MFLRFLVLAYVKNCFLPHCRYLITLILLCRLVLKVDIVPPSIKALKFSRFLRCGKCFLWLATSLLADGLAVAGQVRV
ncbi:hypothetical protein GW17_00020418 [Ensete ventricosum]|nr:hypothetical protein GW17_00020418 [Ensete ventricosum]RZS28008.1 hypothetical protein BHM03_00061554 [Ensete ventricosum]